MPDLHPVWVYVHIVLLVYWLGADVGLYIALIMVRNPALGYPARLTLIRLAILVDLFPRITFALMLPVGMQLARDLGLYDFPAWLIAAAWLLAVAWSALHVAIVRCKGTPLAARLARINQLYELVMGAAFVAAGAASLAWRWPFEPRWFALKILLFGLVFWMILAIDVAFRPFTMILRMGPEGSTPEREREVSRAVHATMAWAALLYACVLTIAFLGTVKPFW